MSLVGPNQRSCEQCGTPFEPRSRSGASVQRFCCTACRLGFHKERLRRQRRGLYAGRGIGVATLQAGTHAAPRGLETGVVLIAWDQRGNLLLRQGPGLGGDHELYICRDYFPQFLETVDALREVIMEAVRKDRAR